MNRSLLYKGLLYREWKHSWGTLSMLALAVIFQPILGTIAGVVVNSRNGVSFVDFATWAWDLLHLTNEVPLLAIPFFGAVLAALSAVHSERQGSNLETVLLTPVKVSDLVRAKFALAFLVIAGFNLLDVLVLWIDASAIAPLYATAGSALLYYLVSVGIAAIGYAVAFVVALGVGRAIASAAAALILFGLPNLILAPVMSLLSDSIAFPIPQSLHVARSIQIARSMLIQTLQNIASTTTVYYYLSPFYYLLKPMTVFIGLSIVCLTLSGLLFWAATAIAERIPPEHFRQTFVASWIRTAAWWFFVLAAAVAFGVFAAALATQISQYHPDTAMTTILYTFSISVIAFAAVLIAAHRLTTHLWRRFSQASL